MFSSWFHPISGVLLVILSSIGGACTWYHFLESLRFHEVLRDSNSGFWVSTLHFVVSLFFWWRCVFCLWFFLSGIGSAAVTKCRVWSVDRILRTFETFADLSALRQSKPKEQTNIAAILKMVLDFANIWWDWFASILRAKAPTKKHKLNWWTTGCEIFIRLP